MPDQQFKINKRILVTGAGGFIGSHLVRYLKDVHNVRFVRGVDIKYPEFTHTAADDFKILDLRDFDNCMRACDGVDWVFNLAADMGGIGYITKYHAKIFRNNILINSNMIEAARRNNIKRYLFSSSACVYPQGLQSVTDLAPLKESDAYPADAERGYGWEKLFSEMMCEYYHDEHNMRVFVPRFHNIFGTDEPYEGGREKAPGALARKISLSKDGDVVEIWGDGLQTRSFCHVSDCVRGLIWLIHSGYHKPVNLGQDRLITINWLAETLRDISGKKIEFVHNIDKPQGVRGRNCDSSLLRQVTGWKPLVSLEDGFAELYRWVDKKINAR